MHSLDWNDLRYFLAIRRAGTLAGAARDLGVRHSTVGRRLEVLEGALGASLFTRTPDGFILTEAGNGIVSLAEDVERAVAAVERRTAGIDERIEGIVRLTASEAFSGFLVRRLGALHARHPGLIVEILSGNRSLDLSRGEADLAVRIAGTSQPDLICKRIGDAGWSLYASEDYVRRCGMPRAHAGRSSLLARHAVIAYDDALARTPGGRWIEAHGAGATVAARTNNAMAALDLAAAGLGLAAAPVNLGARKQGVRAILRPADLGGSTVFLVTHRDLAKVPRIRATMDRLAADISAGLAALGDRRR